MATSQRASVSASAGSPQSESTSSSNDGTSPPQASSASSVQNTDSSSTPATTSSSSSSTTTSSSTPTTTSSSPTSASPTTTPVTTVATTSPTEGQTTTSSPAQESTGSSTGSPATTATPTTASSITFTSQVATTLSSTNPAGSVVYYTTTVPEVVSTTVGTTTSGHSSSSHTGVIVGSVVGGVAGLALIVLLLFCIRRRRSDEFDGNFDPDHVGGRTDGAVGATLPQVDFADEVTAVTPFPHPDNGMRQYGETPYLALPSSPGTSAQFSSEFYGHGMEPQPQPFVQPGLPPSGYIPPVNLYGAPSDWSNRTSPPPSTVSNRTSSARAAKEREAVGRQAGTLGLATQPEAGEGSGEVVVHEDAGRAPSEELAPPREIPPSYDSIRQD